jgi:hypothetical protein
MHHVSLGLALAFSFGLTLLLPITFLVLRPVFRPVHEQQLARVPADRRAWAERRLRKAFVGLAIGYLVLAFGIPLVLWAAG